MSKGFDKFLKEFEKECMESMDRVTESLEWHDIILAGQPADVHGRNTYRGYVYGKYFYYLGHDKEVKFVPVEKLGNKLELKKLKPQHDLDQIPAELIPAESVHEGFISSLPTGWLDWKKKHGLTKVFSQKKLDSAVNMFKHLQDKGTANRFKSPLIVAAQMLDLDPRILANELESRGIDPEPRRVAEGNPETKKKRPDRGKPRGMKFTNTMGISRAISQSKEFDLVNSHALADGYVALFRDKQGDAYEVTIKPSYYGDYFDKERGVAEQVNEADYPGAIGFEEVMKFYDTASPKEMEAFNAMLDQNKTQEAWHLINSTVGSQIGVEEEILDKYATMKSKPDDYLDGDKFVG